MQRRCLKTKGEIGNLTFKCRQAQFKIPHVQAFAQYQRVILDHVFLVDANLLFK